MEVTTIIILVEDMHGNRYSAVCGDMSDIIQICGMKNPKGESIFFETEAYHIEHWCSDNGISRRIIKRIENFQYLWTA